MNSMTSASFLLRLASVNGGFDPCGDSISVGDISELLPTFSNWRNCLGLRVDIEHSVLPFLPNYFLNFILILILYEFEGS